MLIYSDDMIEEVKNASDIVDTISQYVTLKRSGRNFFGLCPFHKEKSPSFSVSPDKQIFHCFGCGTGGNVIHFLSKIENMNFREAIESLAEQNGIILPQDSSNIDNAKKLLKDKIYEINKITAEFYHENLYKETSKQAQEYIKKRKLDNSTLKSFIIGYSGNFNELYTLLNSKGFTEKEILESGLVNKNDKGQYIDRFRKRLMFPILDVREKVIGFGGRVLDDSMPKYINSAENLVYNKGRNLYGLNVAKKHELKQIIIVEGYMDAISLHQREIGNVVASLGTALTENQGRLLRKYTEKIIIGYDSDGAGQTATLRGLEILQDLGCDVRILQLEGAKDPDEFVIKYGSGKFNIALEQSISLVEFKVKMLKRELNLEMTNDKIKFLNGIAKILSNTENNIEQEVYIDKISEDYKISKESLYAQINKLKYPINSTRKILERKEPIIKPKEQTENITEAIINREKMLIYLLVNNGQEIYIRIKEEIKPEDFRKKENIQVITKLYEEFETGNNNIYKVLDSMTEQELINNITESMATEFDISDTEKCLKDVIISFKKDKLNSQKKDILNKLAQCSKEDSSTVELEKELNDIIIKLAKLK